MTTITLHQNEREVGNSSIVKLACKVTFSAAAGYLAGHFFEIIHPMGGAVFAATTTITAVALSKVIDLLRITSPRIRETLSFVILCVSIGTGITATTAVGFALTPPNGALLVLATSAIYIFNKIVLQVVLTVLDNLGRCLSTTAQTITELTRQPLF